MHLAIIGAGFSGITSAKNLRDFGHSVVVYEKCPDVGGVWSITRRYPNLHTQNARDTYHLSDMAMPDDYPEWPESKQVQRYLEAYVAKHKLSPHIHLNSEVTRMERPASGRGWLVTVQSRGSGSTTLFDHVVVANGTFSEGSVPHFPGLDTFQSAGGRVGHTSDYNQLGSMQDQNVLVIGYGKSSCDIANAIADTSTSTTVVARKLIWKLPRKILNVLNYKFLLLTRFGESLFKYIDPSPMESFLHGWGSPIRKGLFGSLGAVIKRQLNLVEVGLLPEGGFERIASSTISLSTEGFYEKVKRREKLFVKRDAQIERLFVDSISTKPMARFTTGEQVRADVVICGTGFHQRAPFLPNDVRDRLTDANGNWIGLYRHILPIGIPDLTFNGYNSSLFCATSSEVASLWIAAYLQGDELKLPSEEEQSRLALARFHWLDEKARGKTAHGTNTVPFSLRPIDDLLLDLNLSIPFLSKARQWLLPVNPSAYKYLNGDLKKRIAAKQQRQPGQKKVKTL